MSAPGKDARMKCFRWNKLICLQMRGQLVGYGKTVAGSTVLQKCRMWSWMWVISSTGLHNYMKWFILRQECITHHQGTNETYMYDCFVHGKNLQQYTSMESEVKHKFGAIDYSSKALAAAFPDRLSTVHVELQYLMVVYLSDHRALTHSNKQSLAFL